MIFYNGISRKNLVHSLYQFYIQNLWKMGAYLSEPNLEKVSEDDSLGSLSYGASAMQGWRLAQEDAHNCILKLDEETAMFAVYDGHGGSEVATYCSKYLPDCILNQAAYKEGKLRKALENTFMEFDERLKEPSVIKELKQIAGLDKMSDSADEEEAEALQEEANLPLNDLLAKYQYEPQKMGALRKKLDRNDLLSPMVRKKQPTFPNGDLGEEDGIIKDKTGGSSSASSTSSSNGNGENRTEDETKLGDTDKKESRRVKTQVVKANGDSKTHKKEGACAVVDGAGDAKKTEADCNGEAVELKEKKQKGTETNQEETKKEKSAEENDSAARTTAEADDEEEEEDSDECEDEDSDDEEDSDVDEDFEENEEDEEESEDDAEDEGPFMQTGEKEEPGSDSGCTAVVALLRNKHLIVANAGDSRCVLSRGGQALDLSFDHKPEDKPELDRIEKAGGKVTPDGRVNGGLNLSRAIGDHCYKCNTDLPPEEQMISAFPDIETTSISDMDQFMVVACDGIWNVLSSQETVDFVVERIGQENENGETYTLSGIIEELFDACMAPDTSGDGTGCDNMTCVIVQFNHDTKQVSVGSKRKTTEDTGKKEESANKRTKSDS